MRNRTIINTLSAIILAAFALLTLFLSSSIIFDWFDIRAKEGNYVPFIVWTNFICGAIYMIAVYGFIKRAKWTFWVLITALILLIIALVALQFYINNGGVYEDKTIKAMLFRIVVTITFSFISFYNIKKKIN